MHIIDWFSWAITNGSLSVVINIMLVNHTYTMYACARAYGIGFCNSILLMSEQAKETESESWTSQIQRDGEKEKSDSKQAIYVPYTNTNNGLDISKFSLYSIFDPSAPHVLYFLHLLYPDFLSYLPFIYAHKHNMACIIVYSLISQTFQRMLQPFDICMYARHVRYHTL